MGAARILLAAVPDVVVRNLVGSEDERKTVTNVVDIFRRPEFVPDVVEAAIRRQAKVIWMQLGVGNQGAADRALAAGLEVIMERCILVEHRALFG